MVSTDAGSRRRLVTCGWALAFIAGVLGTVVACSTRRDDRIARSLPADCRAPVLYVALGDSTVEGVGASGPDASYVSVLYERLRAVYPEARAENLGVAGAESLDVLERQLPRAVAITPDLVTLSVGPNDVTSGVTADDYARNVDRILERLTRETRALVVVNLLPDITLTPLIRRSPQRDAFGRITVQFNEVLAKRARAHGVVVVDLHARSREELPRRPELLAADGYHPSDLGYARWAELMWAQVSPVVARC